MHEPTGESRAHTLVSGRGLVDGVWHADISRLAREPGFEARFLAGRFDAAIDLDDLRSRPEDYHFYVAYPCPFAHRVILVRALLGLTGIGMSVCHPWLTKDRGWMFAPDREGEPYVGLTHDAGLGKQALHEVYSHAAPGFTGRVTVPALVHLPSGRVVSNDSLMIMAALAKVFDPTGRQMGVLPDDPGAGPPPVDARKSLATLEPFALAAWVADRISVGAYRAGMARTQNEYERFLSAFFQDLDRLEGCLALAVFGERHGRTPLASLILLATWVRWEPAYRLVLYLTARAQADYPALARECARLLSDPIIAATVHQDQIVRHYVDDDVFVNRRLENGRYIIPASYPGARCRSAPTHDRWPGRGRAKATQTRTRAFADRPAACL